MSDLEKDNYESLQNKYQTDAVLGQSHSLVTIFKEFLPLLQNTRPQFSDFAQLLGRLGELSRAQSLGIFQCMSSSSLDWDAPMLEWLCVEKTGLTPPVKTLYRRILESTSSETVATYSGYANAGNENDIGDENEPNSHSLSGSATSQTEPYKDVPIINRLLPHLLKGSSAQVTFEGLPQSLKDVLSERETTALKLWPIFKGSEFWGVVVVEINRSEETWASVGDDIFAMVAHTLGASFTLKDLAAQHDEAMEWVKQSEDRLRNALEAAEHGVWDWNFETERLYYSPIWKAMLGYEESEIGDTIEEYEKRVHPDDLTQVWQLIHEHIEGYTPGFKAEFRMQTKAGEWIWVLGRGRVMARNDRGKAIRLAGTNTDITPFRKAQEQLKVSEENFRELFEGNKAIKLVIDDKNGSIVHANSAAVSFYGYPLEVLTTMNVSDINIMSAEEIRAEMDLAASEKRDVFLFKHRIANGEVRDVEVRSGPVRFNGNKCLYSIIHDVTDKKLLQDQLEKERNLLKSVLASTPDVVSVKDVNGRYLLVNDAFLNMVGKSEEAVIHHTPQSVYSPEYAANLLEKEQKAMSSDHALVEEECVDFANEDSPRVLEVMRTALKTHNNECFGLLSIGHDMTEHKLFEKQVSLAASVFKNAHDGILICDENKKIIDVNPMFEELSGFTREEVLSQNPRILNSGRQKEDFYEKMWKSLENKGFWTGELWNRHKDGSFYAIHSNITVVKNSEGKITHYIAIFSDISKLKEHQNKLEKLAHYDALTQLPNRVLLADRLNQAIAHAKRTGTLLAVCFLDLDHFKPINDNYGHAIGDQLLVEVAKRLKICLRGDDTLARLGGDEFVLLLQDLKQLEDVEGMADRILSEVCQDLELSQYRLQVSGSLGITVYPKDDSDPDGLIRHADLAMYDAKLKGRNSYHVFDAVADQQYHQTQRYLARIKEGLKAEEFELFYQPKVRLSDGSIQGFEGLVRWNHPDDGLIFPDQFIDLIDQHSIATDFDIWVLETALSQLSKWNDVYSSFSLSINITSDSLLKLSFINHLQKLLEIYPPEMAARLQIEVLETTTLSDVTKARENLNAIRDLGVEVALDDFGTGYSSLAYLKDLPADSLKIDRSFVSEMLIDSGDSAIVEGIIQLARVFDLNLIAEGVETEETAKALKEMGCDCIQGYWVAKPMTIEVTEVWVKDWMEKSSFLKSL